MTNKTKVIFTDMTSEKWNVSGKLDVIPRIGELVSFPREYFESELKAKVLNVKHIYAASRNDDLELVHVEVIVDLHYEK
ncbi:MAG: hypothetical protein RSD49_20650 [Hafnia sp.]